jgi:hypothetical protein
MTFLKPDRRGISVLYVSLSETLVAILRSCFPLSAISFLRRKKIASKKDTASIGARALSFKRTFIPVKPKSFN